MDSTKTANRAMKTVLNNSYVAVVSRLVLGIVFIIASADKIADPNAFADSVGNYKVVSQEVALIVATILPWMELISGLFLLFGVFRSGAGLVVMSLMAVFTVLVVSALLRGLDITCGCFTQDPAAARMGWWKVGENIGLLVLSAIPTFSTNPSFSIEQVMAKRFRETTSSHPSTSLSEREEDREGEFHL